MSGIRQLVPIAVLFGAVGLAGHSADAGQRYADRVQLPVTLEQGSFISQPAVGDLNGDGIDDVVFDAQTPNAAEKHPIKILLSDGAGSYIDGTSTIIAGPVPLISSTRRFLLKDFNGDGQLDVYMDNHGTEDPCCTVFGEENRLLLSGADGKLRDVTAEKLPGTFDFSHGSSAADVDGDGDIDIWVNNIHPAAYLMLNDGSGGFTIVADLGEGDNQIVGTNGFLPNELVQVNGQNPIWSEFIDADNDGDPDLYLSIHTPATGIIQQHLLLNDGSGHFTDAGTGAFPPQGFSLGTNTYDSFVADLNGDGFNDLLLMQLPEHGEGADPTCPTVNGVRGRRDFLTLFISNGDGTFRDETFLRTPQTTDCKFSNFGGEVVFMDINGDGAIEFMIRSSLPPEIYLNNGFGFFSRLPADFIDVDPPLRFIFIAADVDGDGDSDIVEQPESPATKLMLIRAINTNVTTPNLAPIAFDDSFELRAGRTLEVGLADGVLKNDIEPDRQNLTVELIGEPSNGTLTLNADGSFTYVADRGFRRGTDTFTYKASDGSLTSNVATVAITLEPIAMPWLILLLDD